VRLIHACKSNQSFASEKAVTLFRPGGGKPSGVTISAMTDSYIQIIATAVASPADPIIFRLLCGVSAIHNDVLARGERRTR
jgi:hypothetical protein